MSTEFQWVFDNAETISIDNKPNVSQSVTRGNVVRSLSRGGEAWRFTVKLPDGLPWDQYRQQVAKLSTVGRHTATSVQINNTGYDNWFLSYQGDATTTVGFSANWTQGSNQITLVSQPTSTSILLAAGDLIQLGTGHVYQVLSDVASGSTVVTLNRPVIDSTGSGNCVVGSDVTFNIICTQLPNWSIFQRNQIAWDSEFTFSEVI